jgi:hypothetical protein
MSHIIARLYRRAATTTVERAEYDEEHGSVCTAACRRDSRLDHYHFDAQYLTRVSR